MDRQNYVAEGKRVSHLQRRKTLARARAPIANAPSRILELVLEAEESWGGEVAGVNPRL